METTPAGPACSGRGAASGDRYRHITFLGDAAPAVDPLEAFSAAVSARLLSARERRGSTLGERGASGGGPETAGQNGSGLTGAELADAGLLDPETAALYAALCRRGGIESRRYRETILARRKGACLRALRAGCVEQASALIWRDEAAAERALSAVLVGVTAFFRDTAVFEALGGLLPRLHARRGCVDALSVACSDGSELYSVAMLLSERGLLRAGSLWGIDCREEAIESARAGVYSSGAVEGLAAGLRERYLWPVDGGRGGGAYGGVVRAAPVLRDACRWAVADVFALERVRGLPAAADLILCRNLAIYLRPEAAAELWRLLTERLRPGGVLVVGKAERPTGSSGGALRRVGPCLYMKKQESM